MSATYAPREAGTAGGTHLPSPTITPDNIDDACRARMGAPLCPPPVHRPTVKIDTNVFPVRRGSDTHARHGHRFRCTNGPVSAAVVPPSPPHTSVPGVWPGAADAMPLPATAVPQVGFSTAEIVAYISLYLWQPQRFAEVLRDARPMVSLARSSGSGRRGRARSTVAHLDAAAGSPAESSDPLYIVNLVHRDEAFNKYRNYVRFLLDYAGVSDLVAYTGLHYLYLLWRRLNGQGATDAYRPLSESQFVSGPPKLAKAHPIKSGSEYRLFVTSTLIAHKMLHDETYTCKHWAKICSRERIPAVYPRHSQPGATAPNVLHLSAAEITKMEREFLSGLKHRLHLSRQHTLDWINWIMRFRKLLTNHLMSSWLREGYISIPQVPQSMASAAARSPFASGLATGLPAVSEQSPLHLGPLAALSLNAPASALPPTSATISLLGHQLGALPPPPYASVSPPASWMPASTIAPEPARLGRPLGHPHAPQPPKVDLESLAKRAPGQQAGSDRRTSLAVLMNTLQVPAPNSAEHYGSGLGRSWGAFVHGA